MLFIFYNYTYTYTYNHTYTTKMSDSECVKILKFIRMSLYILSGGICISWIVMLIALISNASFNVYETHFSFNGKYKIDTYYNSHTITFVTQCHSTTSHGNCHYEIYSSYVYDFAENYGNMHCHNKTLHGFITSDKNECTLYDPNSGIYDLLMIYAVIVVYFMFESLNLYLCPRYFRINADNNFNENENENENENVSDCETDVEAYDVNCQHDEYESDETVDLYGTKK